MSDTIERAQEIYDLCLEQEKKYTFESFSKADALRLGLIINEQSKKYNQGIAIKICVNHVVVFSYCQDGACQSNLDWGMRKQRVVEESEMSSLRYRVWMEKTNQTWVDRKLDSMDFAEHGGGFPIRIKDTGVIGSITVSGLPHLDDHQVIVDSLEEYFKK